MKKNYCRVKVEVVAFSSDCVILNSVLEEKLWQSYDNDFNDNLTW